MPEKPTTIAGYSGDQVARVTSTCLYIATKLGDLMGELVVVGGLVPALLIDQENLPNGASAHPGTFDLDLGISFGLVGQKRYQAVTERLSRAGFEPDVNEQGNRTRQRWRIGDPAVTVDFLIEPENAKAQAGQTFSLTSEWAAVIAPGLHLAFQQNQLISVAGKTITEANASRDIRVCGAGAYVVLKALAFHNRTENKDAYDLYYVVRNYGRGASDVAQQVCSLLPDETAEEALAHLQSDFKSSNAVGPRAVAAFLFGRPNADTQADVVGFVRQLLQECKC